MSAALSCGPHSPLQILPSLARPPFPLSPLPNSPPPPKKMSPPPSHLPPWRSRPSALLCHLLLLLTFSSSSAAVHPEQSDQQGILLSLKSHLSNPELLPSWRPDVSPCAFSGVLCDASGSVSSIDLSSLRLSGSPPLHPLCSLPSLHNLSLASNSLSGPTPDLRNCTSLLQLDLAANLFSGPAPDFSTLRNLRLLNFSQNLFSGPFPSASLRSLTSLTSLSAGDNPTFSPSPFPSDALSLRNLTWLYLSNCSLQGRIPSAIGDLTQLRNLELSSNSLVGEIPREISKLTNLWQLELWGNNLTGHIPIGFRNLTKLEYFDASINRLDGDLGEIRFLTNLVSLQLFFNRFSGQIPPELGDFRRLVNLSLYGNQLTGPLPQPLGSFSDFDFIDVSENMLSGPIPPDMCKRGTMRKLLMLDNRFSGEIPATYAGCRTLVRFRVSNNLLSGRVPLGIWGLPAAEIIDLGYNRLEGPMAPDVGNATRLGQLLISHNRFSGEFPPEFSRAAALISIDASSNLFSGKIPSAVGNLKRLNSLLLNDNKFSGAIPETLRSCASLHEVNFAENSLSGEIPRALGSLPSLNSLNLSGNRLSGEIPASLSSLRLSLLDLSRNELRGRVPETLLVYNGSFAENPGLCSQSLRYLRPCFAGHGESRRLKTVITCLLAATAVILSSLGCYLIARKWHTDREGPVKDSWDLKLFQILSFTEQEILNSIKQENLIGQGGSGDVYRVVLGNGKELAVKHIWKTCSGGGSRRSSSTAMLAERVEKSPEFEAEVAALSSIRHVNVVKLYCSITSEDSSLLVYEYLPNGSLWERMHEGGEKMVLNWGTRYEIALGAAKGLEYLHHGCDRAVIHRDVKSSNILLDEFFKPRIADFGLAKIIQAGSKDCTYVIPGTHGYIAPEYAYTCKVNEKSDVYSFGVVLMELTTGKRPINEPEFGDNKDIVSWICTQITSMEGVLNLIDSRIPASLKEDAVKVLKVALLCTARLPSLRPSMRSVVQMLEDADPCRFIAVSVANDKMKSITFSRQD